MDVQAAPPPIASMNTGRPPVGNPPALGQQIPGHTGGLPAQGGLSVLRNPMADKLQSLGRGQDSMLVHMTPDEVNSLQGLAQMSGGSLTTNPHTGLPEAGWLGKLLPSILGAVGMAFGIPPVWMGALGAVGGTAITGDLKQGLMAGLGAFGGASLAGGAGLGSKISDIGTHLPGGSAAIMHAGATGANLAPVAGAGTVANTGPIVAEGGVPAFTNTLGVPPVSHGLLGGVGEASKVGLPSMLQKVAPMAATAGLLGSISGSSGQSKNQAGAVDNSFTGPYYSEARPATFAQSTDELTGSSKERQYFANSQPGVFNAQGQMVQPGSDTPAGTEIWQPVLNPKAKKGQDMYTFTPTYWKGKKQAQNPNLDLSNISQTPMLGMAKGGHVQMDEGSFVMPARETAEFGKGSTRAGQEVLAGLGGIPIQGRGTGVSDDIPAKIGGQEARVADGEVHFPASSVARIGGGDHERGTQKLYAMMKKAEQSRKRAARGGNGLDLLRNV